MRRNREPVSFCRIARIRDFGWQSINIRRSANREKKTGERKQFNVGSYAKNETNDLHPCIVHSPFLLFSDETLIADYLPPLSIPLSQIRQIQNRLNALRRTTHHIRTNPMATIRVSCQQWSNGVNFSIASRTISSKQLISH